MNEASQPIRNEPSKTRIVLLPLSNELNVAEILSISTASPIVVADCYISGVESWTATGWGWQTRVAEHTLLNVDHHAEDERFFRRISSGNLAITYVGANGALPAEVPALINHTDCDSILSAAILTGLLPPDEQFGRAVIAADHSGEPNSIADLLQALDPMRDVELSLRNLNLLLQGAALEDAAVTLVNGRKKERELAAALVRSGRLELMGSVAVGKLSAEERVSGEFLPSLLPAARVIISASPMSNGKWETKVRLGLAAQTAETLFSVGIQHWEPAFRGRWNAGSTKRSGGSTIDPVLLARRLADALG